MLLRVILSWWVCFLPSIMASFHHHCWLLSYFNCFCFLISHECNHLFGLLITLEFLSWLIILLLFIIIVFLWEQWRYFTVTVHYCYNLRLSCDSSPRMIATTHWVWWLYWKFLCRTIKLLLYIMIAFFRAQWYCFTVNIFDCYILNYCCSSSLQTIATICSYCCLYWKYFTEQLYYHHILSLFF